MHPLLRCLPGWEMVPLIVSGEHVATTAVKGTEVHFALEPGCRPRSSWRGAAREHVARLLERRGYLTTRVAHQRAQQRRFVLRLGFRPTWSDADFDYFLLSELPFSKVRGT